MHSKKGGRLWIRGAVAAGGSALCVAGTTLTGGAANAAPLSLGSGTGIFNITNINAPGKCIGVSGGYAGLWWCSANADQTWHWGAQNGAPNPLINGNGQCLAVSGGSTAEGARIRTWTCNGGEDQFWSAVPVSGGSGFYLVNEKSGYVIGVAGGSTANSSALIQYQRLPHADQYWN
jgi:Ricin-type beta-trefoil lectin domain-like